MAKARNRDKFRTFEPALRGIVKILRSLPLNFSLLLYNVVNSWNGYIAIAIRYCVVLAWCKKCGQNVRIDNGVEFVHLANISIGNNVSIHSNCYLDAGGGINIGDDVAIAHQSSILSFDHSWDDISKPIKDNPVRFAPIKIEDDVWVGCGCRILAGVTIQSRSIVAAGAVVTCDVSSHVIVGGVPAKELRRIRISDGDK